MISKVLCLLLASSLLLLCIAVLLLLLLSSVPSVPHEAITFFLRLLVAFILKDHALPL